MITPSVQLDIGISIDTDVVVRLAAENVPWWRGVAAGGIAPVGTGPSALPDRLRPQPEPRPLETL